MMTLLIGGASSGKSAFAETMAARLSEPRYYIAAMKPYGKESIARIERHRMQRARLQFETIERYTDIAGVNFPSRGVVLLECLCNLTANEMFDDDGAGDDAVESIIRGIDSLQAQCSDLIIITNHVGNDGVSYGEGTMRYMNELGRLNILVAKQTDRVAELVCGIPTWLKGHAL